jgi:hypothetical protein
MSKIRSKFNTLYIEPTAMKKIQYYTEAATGEVSGLGTVIKDKDGDYIVEEVFLLEQESSSAETELKPEAISKLMEDMIKRNEDPGKLKFWWHSHANMGVFWSGTDDECAETLSKEFAFSLVVNKSGERKCRVDVYDPIRITKDDIRCEELLEEDIDLKKTCEEEVKEKVKSGTVTYYKGNRGFYRDEEYHGNWRERFGYRVQDDDKPKSRIDIKDFLAEDIVRLTDICDTRVSDGGIFNPEVWKEYIEETIKEIVKKRHEIKSSCASFGSYDESQVCVSCKAKKPCSYWTKLWDEQDMERNQVKIINVEEVQ